MQQARSGMIGEWESTVIATFQHGPNSSLDQTARGITQLRPSTALPFTETEGSSLSKQWPAPLLGLLLAASSDSLLVQSLSIHHQAQLVDYSLLDVDRRLGVRHLLHPFHYN